MGLSLLRASLINLILVLLLVLMVDQSTERHLPLLFFMYTPVKVTECSSTSQSVRQDSHSGAWLQLQVDTQRVIVVASQCRLCPLLPIEKVKKKKMPVAQNAQLR